MPLLGSLMRSTTGSCWFIDEAVCYNDNSSESGAWVVIDEVKIPRNSEYGQASHKVGHILKYTMTVIETA